MTGVSVNVIYSMGPGGRQQGGELHLFVQEKGVLRFVCCTVTLVLSALRITKSGLALSHLSLSRSNLGADFWEILFHTRPPRLSKWCVLS